MRLQLVLTVVSVSALSGWPAVHAKAVPHNAPIVATSNGSYYGFHNSVYNQDIFLGIPFAQPPLNDLRFKPPQSLNTTWSGLRNATELGYSCVGYGEDTEVAAKNYTGEDCLSLNVVRPVGNWSKPLPVAVWIHGGGWSTGSSASSWYNTSFLVERSVQVDQPIIAVGINYRLAGWGFLWSDEVVKEGSTNVGLRDQRGSYSVANHVLAYNGRDDGLFHAAIGQSGSPAGIGPWQPSIDKLSLATANLTQAVCPNAKNKLSCLRKADFATLNNAIRASLALPLAGPPYGPVVDGDIIARPGVEQLRDGDFVKVPYLLGANNDESGYYTPLGVNGEADLHNAMLSDAVGVNFTEAMELISQYPYTGIDLALPGISNTELNVTVGLQFKRLAAVATDLIFRAPTKYAADLWQQHNFSNMYVYNANTSIAVGPRYFGAAHGFELAYTFYNLNGTGWEGNEPPFLGGSPFEGRPKSYLDLAAVMSGMWVGFMNTGVPHYKNQPVPEWPAYKGSDPSIMIFDAQPSHLNTRVGKEGRPAQLDFISSRLFG